MVARNLIALCAVSLIALASCHGGTASSCSNTSQCPAGHVCVSAACLLTCTADANCPTSQHCVNKVCINGEGSGPRIDSVTSPDGSTTDTSCDVAPQACLGTFIEVKGAHLSGATFEIVGPGSTTTSHPLVVTGTASDTTVDLVPANPSTDFLASNWTDGNYTLTATNAGVTAQATVSILKGAAGSGSMSGTDIVTAIGGLGAGGASSLAGNIGGTALINAINGNSSYSYIQAGKLDPSLGSGSTTGGGGSNVVLTKVATVAGTDMIGAADWTAIYNACSQVSGCEITLGTQGGGGSSATFFFRPCHVGMSGTKASANWQVSSDCLTEYVVNGYPSGSTPPVLDAPQWDTQNISTNSGPGQVGNGTAEIVIGAPTTKLPPNPTAYCYLSDATPAGTDNGSGFHFWMDAASPFSACVLVVRQ